MTTRTWTDKELEVVARQLALLHLSVERGYTPTKALRPYLSEKAMLVQGDQQATRRSGPPPAYRDIVRARVGRQDGSSTAYATVVTRNDPQQRSALLMRFHIADGKLLVNELVRAEDREMLLGEARRPPRPENLRHDYTATRLTERLAIAARDQAANATGDAQQALFGDEAERVAILARWERIVADLGEDLAHLRLRLEAHERILLTDLTGTRLGDRPQHPEAAAEWDSALADIAEYRVANAIAGPNPYGPHRTVNDDPVLAVARHAISARVDAARQRINELHAEPQQHLLPDDGPGRDL